MPNTLQARWLAHGILNRTVTLQLRSLWGAWHSLVILKRLSSIPPFVASGRFAVFLYRG
jgi:hypothetical protein